MVGGLPVPEPPAAPAERDRVGAQQLGQGQALRAGVDVVHPLGAEGHRQGGGVKADAAGRAADDEHRCARRSFEPGGHGPVGVGQVIAGAGHGQRIDAGGHRRQHEVGVGDAHHVADEAAVLTERPPEAERRRGRRLARAVRGLAGAAARAVSTGDRPGDDHPLAA